MAHRIADGVVIPRARLEPGQRRIVQPPRVHPAGGVCRRAAHLQPRVRAETPPVLLPEAAGLPAPPHCRPARIARRPLRDHRPVKMHASRQQLVQAMSVVNKCPSLATSVFAKASRVAHCAIIVLCAGHACMPSAPCLGNVSSDSIPATCPPWLLHYLPFTKYRTITAHVQPTCQSNSNQCAASIFQAFLPNPQACRPKCHAKQKHFVTVHDAQM